MSSPAHTSLSVACLQPQGLGALGTAGHQSAWQAGVLPPVLSCASHTEDEQREDGQADRGLLHAVISMRRAAQLTPQPAARARQLGPLLLQHLCPQPQAAAVAGPRSVPCLLAALLVYL